MSLRCGTRTHQNMFSLGVKDAMIGHQTFQVKQNHDTNFYTKTLKQKDWTVKTSSEKLTLTCVNMHVFCKSGFTSSTTMKYWQQRDFHSLPVYMYCISPKDMDKSWHYGLLNFKCLMTNQATFDNQLSMFWHQVLTLRCQQQYLL